MLLLLLACAASGDPPAADDPGGETGHDRPDPMEGSLALLDGIGARNVVFVHVDTLRADHLPIYGYPRDTLPSLAGRPMLVVDGYRTAAPWTLPTTASVFSGLEVASHGATHIPEDDPRVVTLDAPTLAEAFQAAGRRTLLASGNEALNLATEGYFDGFDTVNPWPEEGAPRGMTELTTATFAWLDEQPPGATFFAFLQPMDTHGPYQPDEAFLGTWSDPERLPFSLTDSAEKQVQDAQNAFVAADTDEERNAIREAVTAIYDESILTFDAGLRALLAGLEARGRLDDTLIVIANDHGETLLDDPNLVTVGHGGTVREELVRGGLVFLHPDIPDARVACRATSADLAPTLLRALDLPSMDAVDGTPLQDGCRELLFSSLFYPQVNERQTFELVVTDLAYAVRWRCREGIEERYDLAVDIAGIDSIPAEAVPGLDRYTDALGLHLQFLQDRLGATNCPVTP